MLVRSDAFEQVGLLDERYFFSFEDVDFCLRARARGFKIACDESASVVHHGSASIGADSPRRSYFATRNHLLLTRHLAQQRPSRATWLRLASVAGLNFLHAGLQSKGSKWSRLWAATRGVADFARDRFGPDGAKPIESDPRHAHR
jgi:GT2 family glycosyltransferase